MPELQYDSDSKKSKFSLDLFNTASGKIETFRPYNEECINLYVCGPTVYDRIHLGNARSLVVFDLVAALLRRRYKKLHYVRNITDIDDKILARAREQRVAPAVLTAQTITSFHADARALGCATPDAEPRATEHVDAMISMIERLLQQNNAYASEDGHVLFSIRSFACYGALSRRGEVGVLKNVLEENRDGARVAPLSCRHEEGDFVLWKPASEEDEGWDSPWGRGRPGWHIECSAMSRKHAQGAIDLHGGGQDLIFPHHENEIAQSCTAYPDEPCVRHWMHNGYVLCEGKKMSKSLGNFHTVCNLLKRVSGEAIRLTLLRAHYRHPLDFSTQRLCESEKNLERLYTLASYAKEDAHDNDDEKDWVKEIETHLCNDLNTPLALGFLFSCAARVSSSKGVERGCAARALQAAGGLLGLLQDEGRLKAARKSAQAGREGKNLSSSAEVSPKERAWIEERIAAREAARRCRDFAAADAIRFELRGRGIEIKDGQLDHGGNNPCWRVATSRHEAE